MNDGLRLAVPSDGPLHDGSLLFLRSCGLGVLRTNLRRYEAEVPSLPGVKVHFQRGSDIVQKVEEGSTDIGLVGYDHFMEMRRRDGVATIVIERLGFGHAQLVLGVPDSWVDVVALSDVADLALEFRDKGKDLRIASKFPRLVERFLLGNGITYFSLVSASGSLEAAPALGYADIIADISSTGTTLRENRLKSVHGGVIMSSEACLISNTAELAASADKLASATSLVERIEGYLQSLEYYGLTANMRGESADEVAAYLLDHDDLSGLTGPTISKVYSRDSQGWYAVTVMVEQDKLLAAVERLRSLGASSVTVSHPSYMFQSECKAVARLTGGA